MILIVDRSPTYKHFWIRSFSVYEYAGHSLWIMGIGVWYIDSMQLDDF